MTTRRRFIQWVPAAAGAAAASRALGQAPAPMLDPNDPQAKALGYVTDAKQADKTRFPKYQAGQHCAVCQLYQGPATAPSAPCTIFGGKRVAGPGWCSAFVQKTG